MAHLPNLDALTHVTIAIKATFDNVTFGIHMNYAFIAYMLGQIYVFGVLSLKLYVVCSVVQECIKMHLIVNCTGGLGNMSCGVV